MAEEEQHDWAAYVSVITTFATALSATDSLG